jgi:pimeloyl-ACP methyl ester carboxylesterase
MPVVTTEPGCPVRSTFSDRSMLGARMTDTSPTERNGARIHDLELPDATQAFLVEPVEGGRGVGVLFLHWFDTDATDGDRTQFLDEATELARTRGVVSILPQGRFPWAEAPTDAKADAARIRAEVARHRSAVDLLAARDDVEPGRIGLVGHDFGAMHGVNLAADDARIAAVVLIAATPRWGDWFLPFWPIAGDRWDYLRALAELDPITRIGELAPRPVCLQFARGDFYIADMAGLELHRAAGEPKEIHAYQADHAVRHPDARADRLAFLAERLTL